MLTNIVANMNESSVAANSTIKSATIVFESHCHFFHETYVYSSAFKWNFLFIGITNVFFAISTGTLNLFTLIIIRYSKPLHTSSNMFIAGLAVCDLLTGFVTFPLNAALNFEFSYARTPCALRLTINFVGYLFGQSGLLTLVLIATDRFFAVFYPYQYEEYTHSKKNILYALISVWVLSLVFVAGSFFTPKFMLYTIFVSVTLLFLLVWSFYSQGKILKVTRQILREIRPTVSSTYEDETSVQDSSTCHKNDNNNYQAQAYAVQTAETARAELREIKRKAKDTMNAIKVTALIIGAQYLSYIPHAVVVIMYLVVAPTTSLHMAHGWTSTLALINSFLNPLIYCWQLKGFVRAAKIFFKRNT